jgi:hypothetical protein
MSQDDRSLERAARSWLEEGPTQAPDWAVDAALIRTQRTRQETSLQLPRRLSPMRPLFRVAPLALVAVVALALGLYSLRPGATGGQPTQPPLATASAPPTATPAPTDTTLAAYRAARDAVCARLTASPIPDVPDWAADPSAAAAFLTAAIDRGNQEVTALAALSAPSTVEAEHLANIQTARDTVAVLDHERQLLLDGKVSDALAVDAATAPLNSSFQAFEAKYGLAACP